METELSKKIEIDGEEYMVNHASPSKAWVTSVKLTKMIAEPFSSMAQAGEDEDKAVEMLPRAIKALMANIGEKESLDLILEIFSTVEYRGKSTQLLNSQKAFDSHFHGKMGHMLKVLGAAVEFQFSDFITAIGDGVASLMGKKMGKKT